MAQKEHTHRHQHKNESWRRLGLVLILTMLYMFAEVIGAWWTGSLALLADAGHMFTDVAALILARRARLSVTTASKLSLHS